jgi:hypothetical protein
MNQRQDGNKQKKSFDGNQRLIPMMMTRIRMMMMMMMMMKMMTIKVKAAVRRPLVLAPRRKEMVKFSLPQRRLHLLLHILL